MRLHLLTCGLLCQGQSERVCGTLPEHKRHDYNFSMQKPSNFTKMQRRNLQWSLARHLQAVGEGNYRSTQRRFPHGGNLPD